MANQILIRDQAGATFSISIAGLTTGIARQSAMITNSGDYPAALITLRLRAGASAPTAGTTYDVYLLRGDDLGIRDDGAAATDTIITIENAAPLGSLKLTATANKYFYGVFDTAPLGPLGPEWGIAIKNNSGQTMSSTEGDHYKRYLYYVPEVQ